MYEIRYRKNGTQSVSESDYALIEISVCGREMLVAEGLYLPLEDVDSVTKYFHRTSRTGLNPICQICPFNSDGKCATNFICSVKRWEK